MTKLYYTDPLQAAYMAREFGVKYNHRGRGALPVVSLNIESGDTGAGTKERYFIHPDSYHIFVEDDGDIIETTDFRFGEVIVREDGVAFLEGLDRNFTTKRIVLRDNKPFFMPETLSVESE